MLQHDNACFLAAASIASHTLTSRSSATFRGRDVPGAPPLCGSSLRCLGLMLSRFDATGKPMQTFVPGRFALEVHALGTYS